LRCASDGEESDESFDETVLLEQSGQRVSLLQAYPHRGRLLQELSLYDYMSVVRLKRRGGTEGGRGLAELDSSWPPSRKWVQVIGKPGKHVVICLDGYLSMEFGDEDDRWYRRCVQSRIVAGIICYILVGK
jgi:hypothetical protein